MDKERERRRWTKRETKTMIRVTETKKNKVMIIVSLYL